MERQNNGVYLPKVKERPIDELRFEVQTAIEEFNLVKKDEDREKAAYKLANVGINMYQLEFGKIVANAPLHDSVVSELQTILVKKLSKIDKVFALCDGNGHFWGLRDEYGNLIFKYSCIGTYKEFDSDNSFLPFNYSTSWKNEVYGFVTDNLVACGDKIFSSSKCSFDINTFANDYREIICDSLNNFECRTYDEEGNVSVDYSEYDSQASFFLVFPPQIVRTGKMVSFTKKKFIKM